MNEFERMLEGEKGRIARDAQRVGMNRRHRTVGDFAAGAIEKQVLVEGVDARAFLGDRTPLARDFLETMRNKGFPGAETLQLTRDKTRVKSGILGRNVKVETVEEGLRTRGYLIGKAEAPDQRGSGHKALFLCEDARIRAAQGKTDNYMTGRSGGYSPVLLELTRETVSFGHYARRSFSSMEIDTDGLAHTLWRLDFVEMPFEKVLTDIALGRAPHRA